MSLVGIESVTYGIDDFEACTRFWNDFGLSLATEASDKVVFKTIEGAEIVLRHRTDPDLPHAIVDGPTMREVIWGVDTQDSLNDLADRLAADQEIQRDPDGTVHFTDPQGYRMGLRISQLRKIETTEEPTTGYNAAGLLGRLNERAKFYEKAEPMHLAHVVFRAPNLKETQQFYVDKLDMRVTDVYRDRGYFLRCDGSLDHHHLFLFNPDDSVGFHHAAFEVRDIHEVFGGGLHMTNKGWETHIGPGRHAVTSAYFWYLKNPCGGAAEYDFDTDVCDDNWEPKIFEPTPESFAEWAMADGIEPYGGIQTAKA